MIELCIVVQRFRIMCCSVLFSEYLCLCSLLVSHFHFSLSCIGEGNGNPVQCSCLENPRDGGAWWAPVSGVAQSRTRLKRLSSSSSLALRVEAGSRRAVHLEPFGPTAASLPGPRAPRPRPASAEPLPYLPFSERAGSRRDIVGQFL